MQNLFRFLIQYGNILTFALLEIFCFSLIIDHNQKQRDIFIYSKSLFTGKFIEKTRDFKNYLHLSTIADSLADENAHLRAQIRDLKFSTSMRLDTINRVINNQQINLIAAQVISNSINLRNNRMMINKGGKDGIQKGMGVLVDRGVVGVVTSASDHYSVVLPIASAQSRISASIKRTNYFGLLKWKGGSPKFFIVDEIPIHADVAVGDTIITSGYSTIFPRGIELGTVSKIVKKGGNVIQLETYVNVDLSNLRYVYVVDLLDSDEIDLLLN